MCVWKKKNKLFSVKKNFYVISLVIELRKNRKKKFYWELKKKRKILKMEFITEFFYDNATIYDSSLIMDYENSSLLNNFTTTEVPYVQYEDRLETYIIPTIFALIFIIGVLGNGCLILIFFRHRTMRNVPNTWVNVQITIPTFVCGKIYK